MHQAIGAALRCVARRVLPNFAEGLPFTRAPV
jgi:hypothetical protein